MLLGFLGLAVLSPSGWLGGSLVYEHGVGVERATVRPDVSRRRAA